MDKRLVWLFLLVTFVLGAYLRFNDVEAIPAWYPDEGSNIAVAVSLLEGEPAYMVFGRSSFINPHPHLFYFLLAGLFRVGGIDILWARLLSASCGFLALLLVYPVTRSLVDRRVALFATLFYAISPASVVYSRFAFTYNLLTPLYLLGLYALYHYLKSDQIKWLLLTGVLGGLALVVDLAGLFLIGFLLLALLFYRPRHLLLALPLFLFPVLLWAYWAWRVGGDAFLFDVAFAFTRVSAPLPIQLVRIIFYYREGLSYDFWFALGNFGLLLLPQRRSRWLVGGLYFSSLFMLLRTVDIGGLGYYYAIPLFPFTAVGVALLLVRGLPALLELLRQDVLSYLTKRSFPLRWKPTLVMILNVVIVFFVVVSPLVSTLYEGLFLNYGFFARKLALMDVLSDPDTARQATAYVNTRTSSSDVVLASPTITWLLEANAADFQMAIAATGQAAAHFPAGIPASRFRFNPRLENAAYVIMDPFWRGWASAQMPEVLSMVRTVEEEWVFEERFGAFEVYRRPDS